MSYLPNDQTSTYLNRAAHAFQLNAICSVRSIPGRMNTIIITGENMNLLSISATRERIQQVNKWVLCEIMDRSPLLKLNVLRNRSRRRGQQRTEMSLQSIQGPNDVGMNCNGDMVHCVGVLMPQAAKKRRHGTQYNEDRGGKLDARGPECTSSVADVLWKSLKNSSGWVCEASARTSGVGIVL